MVKGTALGPIGPIGPIMDQPTNNIRNLSLIGDTKHGKSTLLINILGVANDDRLTAYSLNYDQLLINLIDTPGDGELLHEVTASLRITDGALVVVDYAGELSVQTEILIRQALEEGIKPVLILNKIDKCFFEEQVDGELAYQTFQRVIKSVNVNLTTDKNSGLGDVQVSPEKGTVGFSSGLHGWAFTLTNFAKMYAVKFGVDVNKMMERLWGENFFDTATRKWTTENTGSPTCKRGFVLFCYEPIKQIINACMNDQKTQLGVMLDKLGVVLKTEEKKLMGKDLMKRVMQTWLPARQTMLDMMIFHLPSPATAQKYRVKNLYEGHDDKYATAIENCDPDGPLMMYVSRMVPSDFDKGKGKGKGRFFAFGRVFSGKISAGSKVRIMGPNYKKGLCEKIGRIAIWMGKKLETVYEDVPCGNTVAIFGLDQVITKNATLTNDNEEDAYPIRAMKFYVAPVAPVAVQCKVASDLNKLKEGLKLLAMSDPIVVSYRGESGEHIIAGAGEHHLKLCLKDLQEDLMGGAEIVTSKPIVSFRETVLERSSKTVMAKSGNKLLSIEARPLGEALTKAIEEGSIGPGDDAKVRSKILVEEFGWDENLAERVWCFGPDTIGPNMLVLNTAEEVEVQCLDKIKAGFQEASKEGKLRGEKMRGVCFEVRDTIHRGGEPMPISREVFHASQLTAKPRLLQPVYSVEIHAPRQGKAYKVAIELLEKQGGRVVEEEEIDDIDSPTRLISIKGSLPGIHSFGFSKTLRDESAFLKSYLFHHWDLIDEDE
ncbi:hypothetical protein COLO4_14112 [Corchorus olitorius]|uniref:Translation elongation factor EFG/EF2 domain-containing protein n=1 Tax=Corchorus olitorius TaxID=93759 RepID=A0A1R3JTF8_9ROSI|nr:hypothetical protein COLO4_14112 [Corchorus olitorius]